MATVDVQEKFVSGTVTVFKAFFYDSVFSSTKTTRHLYLYCIVSLYVFYN